MKKKLFSIAGTAAFAVVVAINMNAGMSNNAQTDVTLANVQALAKSESGSNGKSLAQKKNGERCCATNPGNTCTQSPDC